MKVAVVRSFVFAVVVLAVVAGAWWLLGAGSLLLVHAPVLLGGDRGILLIKWLASYIPILLREGKFIIQVGPGGVNLTSGFPLRSINQVVVMLALNCEASPLLNFK